MLNILKHSYKHGVTSEDMDAVKQNERETNKHVELKGALSDLKKQQPPGNKDPAYVIIVTYMRSGSTFLGQLFNQNPKAFYWFEPMDSVYQSMYGTKSGYAIPMDIMVHPNGSFRCAIEWFVVLKFPYITIMWPHMSKPGFCP